MDHPLYVYAPRTPEQRREMSIRARKRMGIPSGCVQIYGIFVPEDRAEPLRSYACEVARRWSADQARQFVLDASAAGWSSEKPPLPYRPQKYGPPLHPRERYRIQRQRRAVRAVAFFARALGKEVRLERQKIARMCKVIERFARFWKPKRQKAPKAPSTRVDWDLVEILLSEHVTRDEIAAMFDVQPEWIKRSLKWRKREGRSAYGSGRRDRT